ncbi:VWA domain-containing protein [Carboxydothermus hydrogenoformans]|uniref:CoxE-like protein n=1 Tax=Carboxydothermus hydrogenoformans (strain ATCC BAA-161 / DSM 6008 / Z-2901) TaxID=246194 RepID=Q3AD06_CARHZ|nr:VWA domain-containing protein [Carboxydothermus hydrogenoformans]ABB15175.1 CoxE-like protein [Carboxydothermus hydrogenoformans Z-2901]
MLKNVLFFVDLLRIQGFSISTGEIEDLLKALALVNPQNNSELKAVFQATLLKSSGLKDSFGEIFDFYFTDDFLKPVHHPRQKWEDKAHKVNQALKQVGIYREIEFNNKEKEVLNSLPPEVFQKLYEKIKQFYPNQIVDSFPLLEKTIKGVLKYYQERMVLPEAGVGGRRKDLFTANLKDLSERDYERVEKLIKRYAGRLNAKASRRLKETRRKKYINLRKTIRANLSHGGVLFNLKYREKKKNKPQITLLIDVSASMAIYAKFALSFLFAVARSLKKIELYLFAEDLEVLPLKNYNKSLLDLKRLIEDSQQWGRGTNLNQALKSYLNIAKTRRSFRQTLLIFSDGKTVQFAETLEELKKICRQYQDVKFLNPVPAKKWQEDTLLKKLAQEVSMIETNSVEHLQAVFSKILS